MTHQRYTSSIQLREFDQEDEYAVVVVSSCTDCGALVVDRAAHDRFVHAVRPTHEPHMLVSVKYVCPWCRSKTALEVVQDAREREFCCNINCGWSELK